MQLVGCIACRYHAPLLGEVAHAFGCVDVLEIRSFDPSWNTDQGVTLSSKTLGAKPWSRSESKKRREAGKMAASSAEMDHFVCEIFE